MDDLADVAPEDFVAARDALARRLKAAGKVAEADEVKRRRKPTVQQWIAAEVHRHHGDAVDTLRAATSAVASAQEAAVTGGDRDALRDTVARRKDALRAVGRAVEQVLAGNGRPAHHRDEVLAAIDAAVTAEVAGGTFGLRDDLELPAPAEPVRDLEAERRAAEARAEFDAASARVERARAELEKAELALAAVVQRHPGVEGDT